MGLIAKQWESFELSAIAENAPAIQRSEMRRAFYAGAWALLQLQLDFLEPDTDEATAGDLERMESIHKELMEFSRLVAEGRA